MRNNALPRIGFKCDYCGGDGTAKPSAFKRYKRHFCSIPCYSGFRKDFLPKEEQPRYGSGHSPEERAKRVKARSILNHAIRDGKLSRLPCEKCGKTAEAHHDDYDKPLAVRWFCFAHHRQYHHEHPHLLS